MIAGKFFVHALMEGFAHRTLVGVGCAAPGEHALQLHLGVCLLAFCTLPELSAYKRDVRS